MKNINIFGAGPSGSIIARRYAEEGYCVNLFEVRDHIAGNLFDYLDEETGVIVHKYGPHIMQTSDKEVIEYIKKYSDWVEFRHKVNVIIDDKEVPLPINFESIDILFKNSESLKKKLVDMFPGRETVFIIDLLNVDDDEIKELSDLVYKKVFENYTTKMWNIHPDKIDKSVLKRVPIRLSYDDGYFTDEFQAVPLNGYTELIKNILDHENINVFLSSDKKTLEIKEGKTFLNGELTNEKIIFTGPLDQLFDYKFGSIPYRSLKFEFEKVNTPKFQERPVVNYPSHPTMTRITDYGILSMKYFNSKLSSTVIGREYPGEFNKEDKDFNEPYYPISNDSNLELMSKYLEEVKRISNLRVIGRLAEYKYKQMAHAIKDALEYKID